MKYINMFITETGQKTSSLSGIGNNFTFNQNSNDNIVRLYSKIAYANTIMFITYADKTTAAKIHMISKGYVEEEDKYLYEVQLPYAATSFTMSGSTEKVIFSFQCFKYDTYGNALAPTVANTRVTVNRSDNNDVLDASYNGTDVDNIWVELGTQSLELQDLETEVTNLKANKVDITTKINEKTLDADIVLTDTDIPSDSTEHATVKDYLDHNAGEIIKIWTGDGTIGKALRDSDGNIIFIFFICPPVTRGCPEPNTILFKLHLINRL